MVVISDPTGDVVGDAAHASTIDVFKVRYKLKPKLPAFSVAVRYRQILLAEEGRQSFVAKIRAGGQAYALVARANGYDSSADLYRVTDDGWQETSVASTTPGASSPNAGSSRHRCRPGSSGPTRSTGCRPGSVCVITVATPSTAPGRT